jgi:hypothetical protein
MRLNELFASFDTTWPADQINTSWPPTTDGNGLAAQAIGAIEVEDVVTDVGPDGTVTITGKLTLVASTPPASTRLTSHLFPSIGFTFRPEPDWSSLFRVAIPPSGGTTTVQIDALPLEVAIPADLLRAHPDEAKRDVDSDIELSEGAADTLITRTFSFLRDAGGAIHLEPHLPISIGPCTVSGLPATAVHELTFIAAVGDARAQVDWLVRDLDADAIAFDGGALAVGGIELDWDEEGTTLHDLRSRIRLSDEAEVVIEDLAVPSVLLPPIPLHGTLGVRRTLDAGESLTEHLSFRDAPVLVPLGSDAHAFLSSLFFTTPADGEDWWSGLTLEGGIAWSDGGDSSFALSLGLVDGDVLRLGFEHSPPGSGLPIIHLDLWKVVVDIIGIKLGVSLQELAKGSPDPGTAIQALLTILISEKPGEASGPSGEVRFKTEDGRPFEAALTDVGWDRGKPTGNLVMPRGAQLHLSRFALEVHEMGLAYENGATYFSISGGIREQSDPLEGGVWFTRLRGKLGGNPDAPDFQLGGIGLQLGVQDVVTITAHGMYRDERLPDGTLVKEQGLGGGIILHVGGNEWGLTVDVFWGSQIPPAGEQTDYLLFLVALFGAIPMGPIELRGIEALYATGLMPKIEDGDREAGELKYYSWLKRARPTALPETRDLHSSWKPTKDAWAFGVGVGISIIGGGSVFQLKAFGAGFDAPTASGLVIVVEFGMFGSKKPLALGVFEYDFRSDAFVLMIQLDITLADLIDNFPEELTVKLGGTITIGNKPGLVALGRLNDPDTWLGGKVELELTDLFQLKLRTGLCVEWQEGEHVGGGLTVSLTVTGSVGVIVLQGSGAFEMIVAFMLSGTNDFVARLRVELGFAIILFGFLRFGISIELLAEWLAHVPNYFVFRVTFRFETPWFLPDVSYTVECVRGSLEPTERGVATSPLMQASAQSLTSSRELRVQRFDGRRGGEPTELASVDALAGTTGAWQGDVQPIPLDATVEIDFSVMLVDALGIDAINPDLGHQVSGDGDLALTTRYTLVGITMRRRPLSGGAWGQVEDLTSATSPRNFRWSWDHDTRVNGQIAPKKLLLNGRTPFTVGIGNPLADAEILADNPSYPCCQVRRPDVARFDLDGDPFGSLPAGFVRDFRYEDRGTVAPVRIHGTACVVTAPAAPGATASRVGAFGPASGVFATVVAADDLAVAVVRVAVSGRRKVRLVVVAHDRDGEEIHRYRDDTGASPFAEISVDPGRSFASMLLAVEDLQEEEGDTSAPPAVVLDSVDCITTRDRDRFERERDRCSREEADGHAGTVTFLARHEYEITLTTEVAVKHSSTTFESSTVVERVGFTTAGPPGLNETPEPGLELEPYLVSHRPGGRGLTYREESVHLVLSDALKVFGPGTGATESTLRLPITIAIESAFDANPAAHTGKSSRASADWFLARRGEPDPWLTTATLGIALAVSHDGRALRYKGLAEASPGTCAPDDVWIEQCPRVGVDPFDPSGRALWEPLASYVAVMRLEGGPVVERAPFEAADIGAFSAVTGTWTVADGVLEAPGACMGSFGDPDWDLYRVDVRGVLDAGGELGVVVLADPTDPAQAVRAFIRRGAGDTGTLVVQSGTGADIGSVPLTELGAPRGLTVEVFADAVRCRCSDAVVTVPREDRGPGACQLLATAAHVRSLHVHGIDMYRQPFRTSRYGGFAEHVGTCAGLEHYDTGTAAEALGHLRSRLGGAIAASMDPTSTDADRERCFAEAASALAVPLREDPARVHLTCVVGGADRWLLLEGPEPMDFTEEATLTLSRMVVHGGIDSAERARLGALIEAALQKPRTPPFPFPLPDRFGARRLVVPDRFPGILDAPGARKVAFTARVEGKSLVVIDTGTGVEKRVKAPRLSPDDRALLADVTVDLNTSLHIIRWHTPSRVEWVAEQAVIIQNAQATHALVLPSTPLAAGEYRLELEITRRWFDTLDAVGSGNAYLDEGVIGFTCPG